MANPMLRCIVNIAKEAKADTFPPKRNPANHPRQAVTVEKIIPRQGPTATAFFLFPAGITRCKNFSGLFGRVTPYWQEGANFLAFC